MKPWEMNWEQSNTAIEPASATPAKPWEMNWKSAENPEIDVNAYNGTSLIGQPGEDAKPYSKMDLFMKKLFTFEVRDAAESQKTIQSFLPLRYTMQQKAKKTIRGFRH